MPSPSEVLAPRVTAAIAAAFGDEHPELRDADPVLRPSQFADLQANAPLALAKKVGMPPRDVAAKVTAEFGSFEAVLTFSKDGTDLFHLGFLLVG